MWKKVSFELFEGDLNKQKQKQVWLKNGWTKRNTWQKSFCTHVSFKPDFCLHEMWLVVFVRSQAWKYVNISFFKPLPNRSFALFWRSTFVIPIRYLYTRFVKQANQETDAFHHTVEGEEIFTGQWRNKKRFGRQKKNKKTAR